MIGSRSNAPFEHIFTGDDALDKEHPDCNPAKYFQTFERKHMPIKPGAVATVFKIKPLSRRRFEGIAALKPSEQASTAVAYGVIGVENYRLPSGNMLTLEFAGAGSDQHLTVQTLDAFFSPALFGELMAVVMSASDLDPLASGH